jgi:pimeloyl-ACP methyl ester carboxylesterase
MTTSNSFPDTYQSADATVIDYETTGAGAPLVLLHSGMMSREDMRVQIEYFSKFYQVIAIDAREQGRSSASTTQINYSVIAADVIGVLDGLNIDKASIFGQSDGGTFVFRTLREVNHPRRRFQF